MVYFNRDYFTRKTMKAAVANTRAKYRRSAVRMPDSAVRIFSRLGRRKFDMYTIPDRFQSVDNFRWPGMTWTRNSSLKLTQEGLAFFKKIFERGNDMAILEAFEVEIINSRHTSTALKDSTTLVLDIDIFAENTTHLIYIYYEFSVDKQPQGINDVSH